MLDELRDDHAAMDLLLELSIKVDREFPIGNEKDMLGTLIIQVLGHAAKHMRRELVPYSAMHLLWKERGTNDECVIGQNEKV